MPDAMEEHDVQVIIESSWIVSHGSLDSCVAVVSLDPDSGEPSVPPSSQAGKVVLIPPADPVPCEITIKFQGRLCYVESFYVMSTARTYELYSRSQLSTDPEYVCTVRGWIPERGNDPSLTIEDVEVNSVDYLPNSVCEEFVNNSIGDEVTECASFGLDGVKYPPYNGTRGVTTEGTGSMDTLRKIETTMTHGSVRSLNEDLERSIYSSGEDSWVEVKFNESFGNESLFPQQPAGHLGRNATKYDKRSMWLARGEQGLDTEINVDNLIGKGNAVPIHCREEKIQAIESVCPSHKMYEAELELLDHSPWASLTIRLLSLQDRSHVEVDHMVFLVVHAPSPPKPSNSNQPVGCGDSSALLAMLIPSMLQMARGVSHQIPKGKSLGVLSSIESSKSLIQGHMLHKPPETRSSRLDETLVENDEKDMVSPCIPMYANTVAPIKVVLKEDREVLQADVENAIKEVKKGHETPTACVTSRTETTLNSSVGECLQPASIVPSAGEAGRVNAKQLEEQAQQPVTLVPSACDTGPSTSHLCDHENGSKARRVPCAQHTLLERFDRLEELCMRMESYLVRAVERLDQRLTLLESEQSKASIPVPAEPRHKISTELCHTRSLYVTSMSPGGGCLGAEEITTAVSPAWMGSTICENSPIQHAGVEVPVLDSESITNTGVRERVTEAREDEVTAFTPALENVPATVPTVASFPQRKPQLSLDDAWASALSAFSSSCIPTDSLVSTPLVDMDSNNPFPGPSSYVPMSMPFAELDCTLSTEAPEFSGKTSPISRVEQLASKSSLSLYETVCPSQQPEKSGLLLYKGNEDLLKIGSGKATQGEVKLEEDPGESHNLVNDLQDRDASFDSLPPASPNAIFSRGESGKSSNYSGDHAIIDLLNYHEALLPTENKTTIFRVETLVAGTEELFNQKFQNADSLCLAAEVNPRSCFLSSVTDARYSKENVPTSETIGSNNRREDSACDHKPLAHSEIDLNNIPSISQLPKAGLTMFKEKCSKTRCHSDVLSTEYGKLNDTQEEDKTSPYEVMSSGNSHIAINNVQEYNASDVWFGSVFQSIQNDKHSSVFSMEEHEKSSNNGDDHVIADLLSYCGPAVAIKHENVVSEVDTLVAGINGLFYKQNIKHFLAPELKEGSLLSDIVTDVNGGGGDVLSQERVFGSLLREGTNNDLSYIEKSMCISQEFDTCHEDFCEWSSAEILMQGPGITVTEISNQVDDLEEVFLLNNSNRSGGHLQGGFSEDYFLETPSAGGCPITVEQDKQRQLTGHSFACFENFS